MHHNAAGRIRAILKQARDNHRNRASPEVWAEVLDCKTQDVSEIYGRLWQLRDEWESVVRDMEDRYTDASEREYVTTHYDDVRAALQPDTLTQAFNSHAVKITDTVILVLGTCAARLDTEAEIDQSDLASIYRQIMELERTIHDAADLPKSLRVWMLDLLRLIRDGADRYRIRGARGLRQAFHTMLGELADHYPDLEELKKTNPTIFQRLSSFVDFVNTVSARAIRYEKFIENAMHFLPLFTDRGS